MVEAIKVLNQEVNRRFALGVPRGVDRSELISEAHEALAVALNEGNPALRLAIRNALIDLVRHEAMRNRYSGEMPAQAGTVDFRESTIGEFIYRLAARQFEAVRLKYYYGMTESEIAGEWGCSRQAVNHTLSAALESLKKIIIEAGC